MRFALSHNLKHSFWRSVTCLVDRRHFNSPAIIQVQVLAASLTCEMGGSWVEAAFCCDRVCSNSAESCWCDIVLRAAARYASCGPPTCATPPKSGFGGGGGICILGNDCTSLGPALAAIANGPACRPPVLQPGDCASNTLVECMARCEGQRLVAQGVTRAIAVMLCTVLPAHLSV